MPATFQCSSAGQRTFSPGGGIIPTAAESAGRRVFSGGVGLAAAAASRKKPPETRSWLPEDESASPVVISWLGD